MKAVLPVSRREVEVTVIAADSRWTWVVEENSSQPRVIQPCDILGEMPETPPLGDRQVVWCRLAWTEVATWGEWSLLDRRGALLPAMVPTRVLGREPTTAGPSASAAPARCGWSAWTTRSTPASGSASGAARASGSGGG